MVLSALVLKRRQRNPADLDDRRYPGGDIDDTRHHRVDPPAQLLKLAVTAHRHRRVEIAVRDRRQVLEYAMDPVDHPAPDQVIQQEDDSQLDQQQIDAREHTVEKSF